MIVAGNEDFHAAYDTAALQYEDVESDFGWQMEDGFGDFTQIVEELAADVGYDLPDDVTELVYENSLDERIEYKRTHFPDIIDRVIASGNWNSDVL
ncbi:hypothetical protein ACNO8S_16580 (plasmid) [Haloarcula sp. KBTZ06]|uniref:hypothetical protein n=1 Tax=Haloarcula sp. KBTZ06 TaxID=3402682 RepID=UPI003B43A509